MKRIILISVASLFFNLFSLFGCRHEWVDATCTAPKTCTKCEATEGDPLGHSWKDATCTDPKTCTVCKATDGSPLTHSWKDATCEDPKTCLNCKATEGEPNGHLYPIEDFAKTFNGESFELGESDDVQLVSRCLICDGIIASRSADLDHGEPSPAVSNGAFIFTPEDYMMAISELLPYNACVVGIAENDGSGYGAVISPYMVDNTTTMDELSKKASFVQFYTSNTSPLYYGSNASRTETNYDQRRDPIAAMLIGVQKYDIYPEMCNDLIINTLLLCSGASRDLCFHTLWQMAETVLTTGDQTFGTFADSGSISVHAFGDDDGYLYIFISAN